ncbi:MAG: hypothetical protein IPN29_06200 [Saprospiraceae bacterium]|nr:hypothetical protein [Saprospiraceae bacterium]
MKNPRWWGAFALFIIFLQGLLSQDAFTYEVKLSPIAIQNLPGLHSFAVGTKENEWLLLGGRTDGLHARQPFNSFPASENNDKIWVVDIENKSSWSMPLTALPASYSDQLQSSNISFYQLGDTLYLVGGYGYSAMEADHITYPYLTTLIVSKTIQAIKSGQSPAPFIKQVRNELFAVAGGQLGLLEGKFYLVGGHRFDGRYNPMGHGTYIQTYTNQVRIFDVNNASGSPQVTFYDSFTDPVHLRRRDYNLIPGIDTDGQKLYTISSGVFQPDVDLPYYYPVDIKPGGYKPFTNFNQYLSNYHSAKVSMFDTNTNQNHTLFFGGMSRHYYENDILVKDDNVPFIQTISRLSRHADGSFHEFALKTKMPGLKGASAEFILANQIPLLHDELIDLANLPSDSMIIGYIVGGITSPIENPFSSNQTGVTSANQTVYSVILHKAKTTNVTEIDGQNPHQMTIYPVPFKEDIHLTFTLKKAVPADYFITDSAGKRIQQGSLEDVTAGENHYKLETTGFISNQNYMLTLVLDHTYFLTQQIQKE